MTTVVPILPHSNQLLLFLKVASCSDTCTAADLDAVSYCDPLAELYSDTEPGSDDKDNYEENTKQLAGWVYAACCSKKMWPSNVC